MERSIALKLCDIIFYIYQGVNGMKPDEVILNSPKEMEEGEVMYFNEAVVRRLKYYSELKGVSYSRWAIKAGVSPASIYDLINGKSTEPKLSTLKKLCDVFRISLPQFFDVDYLLSSVLREDDWLCGRD